MSATTAIKDNLEAIACPECRTKIILTREAVLFCQSCLVGYPVVSGVPDLRSARAIHFKKLQQQKESGFNVLCMIEPGKGLKESFEVPKGHCVVAGRAARLDPDSDITYVGLAESAPVSLNPQTQQLVEKILAQSHKSAQPTFDLLPSPATKQLGGFLRDADVLIDDRSISRSHAVFFQDDEGVWVLDLVSKNGTYLNGREVEKAKLKNNDVLSLGAVLIKIKLR